MGSRVPPTETFGRQNADREEQREGVRDALRIDGSQFVRLYEKMQALVAGLLDTVRSMVASLTYTRAQIDTSLSTKADTNALTAVSNAKVSKTGDTMSGDLLIPGMTPATSSYTIMYQDGTGRLSKGASSEKYKTSISAIDPMSLGNIFPTFRRWRMINGDGVWRYGYTAEQIAADPVTEQFAIYARTADFDEQGNLTGSHLERDEDGKPIAESIDFIGMMAAQIAQLDLRDKARQAELVALREENAELRARIDGA